MQRTPMYFEKPMRKRLLKAQLEMFISEIEKEESLFFTCLFVSRDSISLNLKENDFISVFYLHSPEAYLELNRTSMMECFPRIINS